jgi:hypothetical protein
MGFRTRTSNCLKINISVFRGYFIEPKTLDKALFTRGFYSDLGLARSSVKKRLNFFVQTKVQKAMKVK